MLGLRGLRSLCGYKVSTAFPLHRQRFVGNKGTATKVKGPPSSHHRPVPWLGSVRPRHRVNFKNVVVYPAKECHKEKIISFLMENYWPREPIATGLYMCPNSRYLVDLTCDNIETGETFMAIEHSPWGPMLLGVCIGQVIYRRHAYELFKIGAAHRFSLEGIRLLFLADCLRKADTFDTYDLQFLYHVEILATHFSVGDQGVGSLLLETVLSSAILAGYPMIQVLATNDYAARICERLKMKKEMSMPYSAYTDLLERPLIYPREPHSLATVYTRKLNGKPPKPRVEPQLSHTFCAVSARQQMHPNS